MRIGIPTPIKSIHILFPYFICLYNIFYIFCGCILTFFDAYTQSHLIYKQLSSQTIFALLLFLAFFLCLLICFYITHPFSSQAFVVIYIIYLFFHILFIIYFCMYFYAYSSAYFFGTPYIPYDLYIFMHYMYLYIYNFNYTKSDFILAFLYALIITRSPLG